MGYSNSQVRLNLKSKEEMSLALIIFTLLAFPFAVVIYGLLLKVLWGWFIVPLGVQAIGVAHALGLVLLFGFLRGAIKPDNTEPSWGYVIGHFFLKPLIFWGFAAIYHSFM